MFQENDYYWYKQPESDVHKSVFAYVRFLSEQQETRAQLNLDYLRLYGNDDLLGIRQYSANRDTSAVQNRVTMNILQSMVDTVHSKITKNKPKPMFLTNNGDWTLQRKARKLNQFIEGQFYDMDYYTTASRCYLDSLVFGTGCAKFYTKDDKVKAERVMIDEIIIDDREALYGEPRQMHQKKWIHRDVLKEMFPSSKQAIDNAGRSIDPTDAMQYASSTYNDMVLVIESWRLPSSKKAKDGMHAISIENDTLFSEPYHKDFFPFVFWRWTLRPRGFFGRGIAEQLTGLQLEINKILRTIQVSMHLVSIPKIFVEASSKIVSSHIDNKIGGIIKYVGNEPTSKALGSIPTELFSHLNFLYTKAYEEIGVSQLSATSQKPSGLDSGKALRVYNDIESERFMANALRYEKSFLDASKISIELAKDIAAQNSGSYPVRVKTKTGGLELIDWKDVALDEDQFAMQMFPTSSLSSTPSARFAEVQELISAGFVSKQDAMKLLDMPDLQRMYSFTNAPAEDIDRAIELIVDKLDYTTPEPFQDLEYGKEKFQQAYLYYKSENAPEEVLELLRRWVSDAEELQKRAEAQVAGEAQAVQAKAQMDAEEQKAAEQMAAQGPPAPLADQPPIDPNIPIA